MDPLIAPDFVASQLLAKINALVAKGRIRQAALRLTELVESYPRFAPAYNALGWLYGNALENPKQAVPCFERALELDPELPPAYFNLIAALNSLGRFDRIAALAERALTVPGIDRGKILSQLGVMFELQANYEQAAVFYRQASNVTLSSQEMLSFLDGVERCRQKHARTHDE